MKKITLLLSFLFTILVLGAQVERNLVLVEVATGTWCYYCPGAAMGADDLVDFGHPVAIVENHNGDPYATDDSDARNSYYSVSGYPTANFDGSYENVVGGSNTETMYDDYYPIVEARILEYTSHVLEIYGTNSSDEYSITIRVQKQAEYESDDLVVRFALTESEIEDDWQGMSEVNFVNRLMVPDAGGTDISELDTGEIFDVDLEFTFDNTWVDNHCELVAFIQDDDTKEVLQTVKVSLLSLTAPPAMLSATFEADAPAVCEEGSITYTPDFASDNHSYEWTFDGGTPSSSTDQIPVVFYDTPGNYDVELVVTDGVFIDTNSEAEFMSVVLPVQTPDQPSGDTELCGAYIYPFSTSEDPYAAEYAWEISPSSAGTLDWDDHIASFEASNEWQGEFTIKVMTTNFCGDSEWSEVLTCTLSESPAEYVLEGGGGYCYEGDGVEITLDNSDTGISYELYFDGEATGNIIDGTGSELSFGLQTEEGDYTAIGSNDNCTWQMMNQIEVYVMFAPVEPEAPEGPASVCNTEVTMYDSEGGDDSETYIWTLTPEEAGLLEVDGLSAVITWNSEFAGYAALSIAGENECGIGNPNAIDIEVQALPSPSIEGEPMVCDEQTEEYSTEANDGSTYTWEVTGGTITAGEGTEMITVQWGTPGTGYLTVNEESLIGCSGASDEFVVVIDDCTAISEIAENELYVFPNPATSILNISYNTVNDQDSKILVYNRIGQVVFEKDMSNNGTQNYGLDVSQLSKGLYILRIQSGNELLFTKQFVKN